VPNGLRQELLKDLCCLAGFIQKFRWLFIYHCESFVAINYASNPSPLSRLHNLEAMEATGCKEDDASGES